MLKEAPTVEARPLNPTPNTKPPCSKLSAYGMPKQAPPTVISLEILMTGVEAYEESHFPIPGGQPKKKTPNHILS